MKTSYLLPHKYKTLGWALFVLGLIIGGVVVFGGYDFDILKVNVISIYDEGGFLGGDRGFFNIIKNSILDELAALTIILGGLLVGFTKEKVEDEFIYKLRNDSLVWAIIFNYVVLAIAIIFVYDYSFFHILVFNMFTPLLFFVFRFNFLKFKSSSDEE
ncbi:MAG: hypothetical protein R2785_00955 [Flavobacteriaceae bacterium]